MTPRYLRSEIIAFDRGGTFARGEYTLSAPQPTKRADERKDSRGKVRKAKTGKPAAKRRSPHIITDVRNGPA